MPREWLQHLLGMRQIGLNWKPRSLLRFIRFLPISMPSQNFLKKILSQLIVVRPCHTKLNVPLWINVLPKQIAKNYHISSNFSVLQFECFYVLPSFSYLHFSKQTRNFINSVCIKSRSSVLKIHKKFFSEVLR